MADHTPPTNPLEDAPRLAHINGKTADLTPPTNPPEDAPAKRDIPYECAFAETFDVLVGRDPNQKLFTVHHELITARSDFFCKARSLRWKKSVPVELQHADPKIFDMYLHCVYRNAVPVLRVGEVEEEEEHLPYDPQVEKCYQAFVDLYILADSLLDSVTTKLVIQEIFDFRALHELPPEAGVINHAYRHTMADCALRDALVEIFARASWLPDGDFPHAFLRSVIEKQMSLRYWQ
jgi:hypothetical protein